MALTDSNGGMVMPVSPMNGGYGNGFGWGGDGSFWIIILFLFAFMGNGWGNGFGGGGAIFNNATNDMQRGFDQQAVMGGINGLTNAVTNGFANAEVSRCNSQANILQTLNANQNANTSAMNSLAMNLQNCCCENRAGLADLKYTVATEACSDRNALAQGLQSVLSAVQNQTQTILDKMCQQEIDNLKEQKAALQTQVNLANLQASQTAQTAKILADNAAQTQALEHYLNPTPIPAYMVQNPNGCGCPTNWANGLVA